MDIAIMTFSIILVLWLLYKFFPNASYSPLTTIENLRIYDDYVVLSCDEVVTWIGESYSGYTKENLLVTLLHPNTMNWHSEDSGSMSCSPPRQIFGLLLDVSSASKKVLQPKQRISVVSLNGSRCLEISTDTGICRITS